MSVMKQIRYLFVALAVGGLLLTAWRYGLLDAVTRHLPGAQTSRTVQFDNGTVREQRQMQTQVVPSMRKCLRADHPVIYTDRDCPSGTQEAQLSTDTHINVVPSTHPQAAAAAASAGRKGVPNVRDLLIGSDTQKLQAAKDQQMDKAVNR